MIPEILHLTRQPRGESMQESQTEREIGELKQKLAEKELKLQERDQKLQRLRKFKTGFFTLLSGVTSVFLWQCAPGVTIPTLPTLPTLTPAASSICNGTS